MNGLKEWWNQNSPRDQMAMFGLGLAVVLYLLYFLVSSTHSKYNDQLNKNARVSASLAKVRELSAELIAKKSGSQTGGSQNVTEQVNGSLRQFNLNLSSMQPQSNGGVRLRLEKVDYGSAIAWLHEMEVNQGLKIKDSSITTTSDKGVVNISVTLLK